MLAALALLIALAGGAAWMALEREIARPGALAESRTVLIPRGVSLQTAAVVLFDAGVVADKTVLKIAARLGRVPRTIRAGEYEIAAQASLRDVMTQLSSGRTVLRRLTVAEGLSSRDVVALIEAAEGLEGDVEEIPEEGTLLPETYFYSYWDRREDIVGRMARAMDETLNRLWETRDPGLPFAMPEDAVILASIVEKETGLASERSRIAGVFINRLKRGMALQSDPTVIYALARGAALGRDLTQKDLKLASPYNTYENAGLPPGPIANPGRAAIEAVLRPMATDDLYFVADGTGGHAFAKTLREHNANVRKWRRLNRR